MPTNDRNQGSDKTRQPGSNQSLNQGDRSKQQASQGSQSDNRNMPGKSSSDMGKSSPSGTRNPQDRDH